MKIKSTKAWAVCYRDSIQRIYFLKKEAEGSVAGYASDTKYSVVKVSIIPLVK